MIGREFRFSCEEKAFDDDLRGCKGVIVNDFVESNQWQLKVLEGNKKDWILVCDKKEFNDICDVQLELEYEKNGNKKQSFYSSELAQEETLYEVKLHTNINKI